MTMFADSQGQAARYQFDLDFDTSKKAKEEEEAVPTITVYDHEAQMAALERRVRAEAFEAGKQQAIDDGANAMTQQAQKLTGVAQTLLSKLDQEIGQREERAVRIAVSASKKLAARLMANEPRGEVEELFRACLAPMFDASHLVVRMNADHVDTVRDHLEGIATAQGFEGRLVFLGEEDFAPGDARIEWADGGLARSQADIEAAIDDLVADYLMARGKANGVAPTANQPTLNASLEGADDE